MMKYKNQKRMCHVYFSCRIKTEIVISNETLFMNSFSSIINIYLIIFFSFNRENKSDTNEQPTEYKNVMCVC